MYSMRHFERTLELEREAEELHALTERKWEKYLI